MPRLPPHRRIRLLAPTAHYDEAMARADPDGASGGRTFTSSFGVRGRESHDATAFYERFTLPEICSDKTVNPPAAVDVIYCGDARNMAAVASSSVALVVTSPPYFAGKEYEQVLGQGGIPATYMAYLDMLRDVFAECARVLEPGGRMAINVANLGRKPYRSLAADVVAILQDDLRLLLRGEVIWQKGRGANGSCAWGSFQSAANPVLRDVTERIVVASKGRFDRALSRRDRQGRGLPHQSTMTKDEFMEATLDVWNISPESANRVGHPAPFPVELPRRLIELYTYQGDLVLDPFMGSGSTAVAALETKRHFVGYDTDPGYVEAARERVERARLELASEGTGRLPLPGFGHDSLRRGSMQDQMGVKEIAQALLIDCNFRDVAEDDDSNGVGVRFHGTDALGRRWFFDVSGAFTVTRGGLRHTEALWKGLGRIALLNASHPHGCRVVLLTTHLPLKNTPGERALRTARGAVLHDAIEVLSAEGRARLRRYAAGEGYERPIGELLTPTAGAGSFGD